ncbi:MarR family winged helix-turn-helix transcriptional regulator [Cucumibacter marinus]|uniref:MarR family winged helix-turn-helix transcriptional regulator n=1 Tax=Cucumibacter marinus TaxID=1121252 RepID=UPI000408A5F1|nr:MarR family winged helix-turn-helix transcriptional regulator [Cucumibacter marinus]
MTENKTPSAPRQAGPASLDSGMTGRLERAGIDQSVIDAVFGVDGILQTWRQRMSKRELGNMAIAELGLDIDLAQLDVLIAIHAPYQGIPEGEQGETMVATVAERLSIDPSRASRLVSELVNLGYARREASQADARRTIIAATEAGIALVDAVRTYKFLIMGEFFAEWTEKERAAFLPLLERFSTWSDQIDAPHSDRLAAEIGELKIQVGNAVHHKARA